MTRFRIPALSATIVCVAALLGGFPGAVAAHDYEIGSLHIEHPWARAMAPTASAGGGYLVVRNDGVSDDRLVAADSPRAGRVELHEMTMDGDVMRMRELAGGIALPAGGTVELKPGGLHVMFLDVDAPFAEGERVPVTLTFEHAGDIGVEFAVEALGAGEPAHHDHHGGHGHGH